MIKLSERDKPMFLMTVGIPGSGKSTFLKQYQDDQYTIIVCPDNIREELTGSISDQTQNGKVWVITKQRVVDGLNSGKNVILDATNVDGKSRRQFIQGLPTNIALKAKIFSVGPNIAKQRIKEQIERGENRSNVPPDVIDRMHQKFVASTPEKLQQEGFELI